MARPKKITTTEEMTETAVVETTTTPVAETATKKKKASAKKEVADDSKERYAYYLTVRVKFTQPLLATNANDPEVYDGFIGNDTTKERREAEIERLGVAEVKEKGMTVFLRDPEDSTKPQLKGYTWLGYLKSRCRALAKVPGTKISSMKAYIKEIDDRIAVSPTFIDLHLPEGAGIDTRQRPLRAQTMQGERVSLAKSEEAPIGSWCEFTFRTETKEGMDLIKECLDYGSVHGTGQWRNAGNGTFSWEVVKSYAMRIKTKYFTAEDFPIIGEE